MKHPSLYTLAELHRFNDVREHVEVLMRFAERLNEEIRRFDQEHSMDLRKLENLGNIPHRRKKTRAIHIAFEL